MAGKASGITRSGRSVNGLAPRSSEAEIIEFGIRSSPA